MNSSTNINTPAVSPLDTLLVQQLTKLIAEETCLATKYPALASATETSEDRAAFSQSLAQLERRADRLQRLIEAMESTGFHQTALQGTRLYNA